ncbi:hypothetical protein KAS24_00540, partial [Candidatus Bathyarchaeota archaeon]|nr:hypothetical protein [Candidatus Bathyarchaeota archaeon]
FSSIQNRQKKEHDIHFLEIVSNRILQHASSRWLQKKFTGGFKGLCVGRVHGSLSHVNIEFSFHKSF